jgi:hypothetical protein
VTSRKKSLISINGTAGDVNSGGQNPCRVSRQANKRWQDEFAKIRVEAQYPLG